MNLTLKIARRYLFAKKSTNAINIITGIAVFGLSVGTAAMVLVLSVFNGFEDLISSMYSNLNPDVLVAPKQGKTFPIDSVKLHRLQQLPAVQAVSKTIEEIAFFDSREQQGFGVLKGVDDNYIKVTNIDSTIREGRYELKREDRNQAVVGFGMRNKLSIDVENPLSFLNIYMAKRKQVSNFEQFRRRIAYPVGTFLIETDFNNNYVITSLDFAQELIGSYDEASALEIRLHPGYAIPSTYAAIEEIMGPDFAVKDRYAQNEAFMKLMQVEKWMSFAIVGLMLLLVAFNMIGALWMIVLEKKKDIAILKSMGATDERVRWIFLNEGLLLSIIGVVVGFLLALLVYLIQKQFSIIGIPGAFVVSAYPISMRVFDFVIVAITVMGIGLLASIPPAQRAKRVPALVREE